MLYKNERYNFYNNLDTALLIYNNTFWKTIKPLFPGKKTTNMTKTKLSTKNSLLTKDKKVAEH